MATKPKACVGRVDEKSGVSQRVADRDKTNHCQKGEKKRDKRKGALGANSESRNDKIGHIIEADFQLRNRQKLQKQLACKEKSNSSENAGASSAHTPVLDQNEVYARIVAAEAMSVLASGLGLPLPAQKGIKRELSPTSVSSRSSSASGEALVISWSTPGRDTPTTTGRDLQAGDYVQEDTVSSSSASKHQNRAKQSPVISSMLENGRSNYSGNSSDPLLNSATNCDLSPASVEPVASPRANPLQHNHQVKKTLVPPQPECVHSVVKTTPWTAKQQFVVSEDYCPPEKRSRTIETQTGSAEVMDIENSEAIPDLNNLSLHPAKTVTCPVKQARGSPPTQPGSVLSPASAMRENRLPLVEDRCCPRSQVVLDQRETEQPNGLTPFPVYHHQAQASLRKSGTPGMIGRQVSASGAASQLPSDRHKPPLPLSILSLPRKQASVSATASTAASQTSSSTPRKNDQEDTDHSLQTAQQQALQRLSDNLARASPKERAFMLGQIQAIVTLQRASQLGQNAQGLIPSVPITPTPHVTLLPDMPMRPTVSTEQDNVSQSPAKTVRDYCSSPLGRHPGHSDRGDNQGLMDFTVVPKPHGGSAGTLGQKSGQCLFSEGVSPLPQTVLQIDSPLTLTCPHPTKTDASSPALSPSCPQNTDHNTRGQVTCENSRPTQVKKNSQHVHSSDTSGSHLPFKKRRMADYPSEVTNSLPRIMVSPSTVGHSETLSPVPVVTAVARVPTVSEPRVSSPYTPGVPGLSDIQTALRKDEDGDIPLHIAAAQGNLAAVDRYIRLMKLAGSSVDAVNKDRQTPLHIAVVTEDIAVVNRLLNAGANVNCPNSIGQTSVHLASKGGCNQCLMSLITCGSGAQLDKKDFEGYSPLHLAVQRGHMNVIQTLLYHGADTNVQDGKSGRTPLFHAAENNQTEIVDLLLKAQAKVNVMNYAGNTAVMAASSRAHKDVVTLLMQYGADTKGTNIGDMTSKGPPVRGSTNAALRQTVSSPSPFSSPTSDSDDSLSEGRRQEKSGRNRNGLRKNKSKKSAV